MCVIPSDNRPESLKDEADLEKIYATVRQMIYVAVTQARDVLLIFSGGEPSDFIEKLRTQDCSETATDAASTLAGKIGVQRII